MVNDKVVNHACEVVSAVSDIMTELSNSVQQLEKQLEEVDADRFKAWQKVHELQIENEQLRELLDKFHEIFKGE